MEEKKSMWEKMGPLMMVAIVAMAFGLGYFYNKSQAPVGNTAGSNQQVAQQQVQPTQVPVDLSMIKNLFKNKDLIKFGDENKKLLIVNVSDPSCPFCSIAAGKNPDLNASVNSRFVMVADGGTYVAPVPEMKKLVDSGKAGYVFVYSNGHGNGEMGTKALYCANEKGKYWEVHDLLMGGKGYELINNTVKNDKNQSGALADFLKPAVDSAFMKKCSESGKYDEMIAKNTQVATSIGVQGTPGSYLNSTNFAGAYSWADMKSVADAALK